MWRVERHFKRRYSSLRYDITRNIPTTAQSIGFPFPCPQFALLWLLLRHILPSFFSWFLLLARVRVAPRASATKFKKLSCEFIAFNCHHWCLNFFSQHISHWTCGGNKRLINCRIVCIETSAARTARDIWWRTLRNFLRSNFPRALNSISRLMIVEFRVISHTLRERFPNNQIKISHPSHCHHHHECSASACLVYLFKLFCCVFREFVTSKKRKK